MSYTPELTYSIEGFIEANSGSTEITYHNYSIIDLIITDTDEYIYFTESNIIDDYIDELLSLSVEVTMTPREMTKYYYNPELLAYDLYGATELSFIILKLNSIIDPKEFNFPTLKLLNKSTLNDSLSEIYNSESKYISNNRYENNINV